MTNEKPADYNRRQIAIPDCSMPPRYNLPPIDIPACSFHLPCWTSICNQHPPSNRAPKTNLVWSQAQKVRSENKGRKREAPATTVCNYTSHFRKLSKPPVRENMMKFTETEEKKPFSVDCVPAHKLSSIVNTFSAAALQPAMENIPNLRSRFLIRVKCRLL